MWDHRSHDWTVEPGEFVIMAGTSVEEIAGEVTVMVGTQTSSAEANQARFILA